MEYILDKESVIQAVEQSVTVVKENINKKSVDYAKNAIDFLNGMTEDEMRKVGIRDMIFVITWARKVVN